MVLFPTSFLPPLPPTLLHSLTLLTNPPSTSSYTTILLLSCAFVIESMCATDLMNCCTSTFISLSPKLSFKICSRDVPLHTLAVRHIESGNMKVPSSDLASCTILIHNVFANKLHNAFSEERTFAAARGKRTMHSIVKVNTNEGEGRKGW